MNSTQCARTPLVLSLLPETLQHQNGSLADMVVFEPFMTQRDPREGSEIIVHAQWSPNCHCPRRLLLAAQ